MTTLTTQVSPEVITRAAQLLLEDENSESPARLDYWSRQVTDMVKVLTALEQAMVEADAK